MAGKNEMASKPNPLESHQNSLLQGATIQPTNLTSVFFLVVSFLFYFYFLFYFQTPSTKKTLTMDTETVQFGVIIFPPIDLMKDF